VDLSLAADDENFFEPVVQAHVEVLQRGQLEQVKVCQGLVEAPAEGGHHADLIESLRSDVLQRQLQVGLVLRRREDFDLHARFAQRLQLRCLDRIQVSDQKPGDDAQRLHVLITAVDCHQVVVFAQLGEHTGRVSQDAVDENHCPLV